MSWPDIIVLAASVVTIVSGGVGAVRYFQSRASKAAPRWPLRQPTAYPAPHGARPHQGAPRPAFPPNVAANRGSIPLGAAIMFAVPILVYAVLGVISSTVVTTSAQDDSTLNLLTFLIGGVGLLAGGIAGGKVAGGVSRALTAMLLAVMATVVGYFFYKNLTKQPVYLDHLLNSDQATYWLRSQVLLVIGAMVGGRRRYKR
jgi:hypothetical protein